MQWEFKIIASKDRRLLSRIFQTLENQMMIIHSFRGEADEEEDLVFITFVISSPGDKAYRIEAMLHRLENVLSVAVATRMPEPGPQWV